MNIDRVALILGTVFLAACAKSNGSGDAEIGIAYAKSELGSLQSCQFHADCANPNQDCVELTSTKDRRCYNRGGAGVYVGCNKGELILLSGDPEQFACY